LEFVWKSVISQSDVERIKAEEAHSILSALRLTHLTAQV
jgi:hypothetical protein